MMSTRNVHLQSAFYVLITQCRQSNIRVGLGNPYLIDYAENNNERHNSCAGDVRHLPAEQGTQHRTNEWRQSIQRHRAVNNAKGNQQRGAAFEISTLAGKGTYIGVFCGRKMSLTEPPATLKNAELKNPVANLKIRKTAERAIPSPD